MPTDMLGCTLNDDGVSQVFKRFQSDTWETLFHFYHTLTGTDLEEEAGSKELVHKVHSKEVA
jgi:hypothetical protein